MNKPANSRSDRTARAPDAAIAERAAAWFVRLQAGAVSADERARFAAWLKSKPEHRRAYEEICAFWSDPDFAEALKETPLATVAPQCARPHRTNRLSFAWGLSLAACAALAWVAVRPELAPCLGADHCTATGEVRTVPLPDGSRATLNTGSVLDIAYEDGLRRVRLLRGEAFFDVTPDSQRPFLVEGHHSQTRVKGTRFVVREEPDGDTVTVVSGVVEVGRGGRVVAVLRKNDQIRLGKGLAGEVARVTGSLAAAWMNGAVLFDNAPLAQVVGEIGRFRRGMLIVAGERAQSLKVSGRFDIKDTDRALESLEQTLPIRLHRIAPWLVLID